MISPEISNQSLPGTPPPTAWPTGWRLHDISVPITPGMPSWPGDPAFETRLVDAIAGGEAANVSWIGMGAHAGTHVDAPLHFFQGGAAVETMPLDVLVGPCLVAEVITVGPIRAADLAALHLPPDIIRLLLKTSNSSLWRVGDSPFQPDFVGLAPDAAAWLVQRGIRLLGVDYLSVEPYPAPREHPVHKALLGAGVVLLEGTDLSAVAPGEYVLACLPLKLVGLEGAPARAILVETVP